MSTINQAQVLAWGSPPTYTTAPPPPATGPDEVRLTLKATALHRVVRSRAAGTHYSSTTLPHVPGIDGVGTTEDGKTVYFASMSVGAMSEVLNVPKRSVCEVPEGLDPVKAAALVNPAMSSWMGMKARTSAGTVREGFGVLILGVTSASGRLAVPLARTLGAGRVVGAARSEKGMEGLGLDGAVVLAEKAEETDWSAVGEVDVILDYIGGPAAASALAAIPTPRVVDYVHIGSLSGSLDVTVPGAVLRSKNIVIRGSGPGAWETREVLGEMPAMLEAIRGAGEQPMRVVELSEVEREWVREGTGERVVFVP